ncbi:hypothetical protein SAMN05192562_103363 [Kosakonia arachidis]|uniref:Uncharacterized protein n=1 Tax=Kosakonia arachidis TaxID=551989 RepID=A0A1I7C9A8_9ENTR|nr:hypothetical protein SAMN05192562_103363 [Kosakonia arachidis]
MPRLFHDHCEKGDIIKVGPPAGNFVLDDGTQPIVMRFGGGGITPMMAMLDAQVTTLKKGGLNTGFTSPMRRRTVTTMCSVASSKLWPTDTTDYISSQHIGSVWISKIIVR